MCHLCPSFQATLDHLLDYPPVFTGINACSLCPGHAYCHVSLHRHRSSVSRVSPGSHQVSSRLMLMLSRIWTWLIFWFWRPHAMPKAVCRQVKVISSSIHISPESEHDRHFGYEDTTTTLKTEDKILFHVPNLHVSCAASRAAPCAQSVELLIQIMHIRVLTASSLLFL